ncbi:MAG: M50 family metallopeptidase [Firmicutes bacterium]|nr:M50 family metallopeptidase [Bacillota bacterium]
MRILRLWGIEVRINRYFLLLLAFLAAAGAAVPVLLSLLLVAVHEAAHVWAARRLGLAVVRVELLPFGGVAELATPLEFSARHEFLVALAGPVCNGLLAAVGWSAAAVLRAYGPEAGPLAAARGLLEGLFLQANVTLALFNLIPAFPLDGGRLWHAWALRRWGWQTAGRQAVWLGRNLGILVAGAGTAYWLLAGANPSLAVLGLFLWLAASGERRALPWKMWRYLAHRQSLLARQNLWLGEKIVARSAANVSSLLAYFRPDRYYLVMVLDAESRPCGVVTEGEILEAMLQGKGEQTVGELLRRRL